MRVRTSRASVISIHAPRTGSDEGGRRFIRGQGISIHAPRTGSDVVGHAQKVFALAFQSTLPARGATKVPLIVLTAHPHFNPRSPHGERRCCKTQTAIQGVFQSTLPARGATTSWIQSRQSSGISIHAPRTGSDLTDFSYMGIADSISIHAPRTGSDGGCRRGGGSHHISIHAPRTGSDVSRGLSGVLHRQFQSTLPARGATRERSRFCPVCVKFQSTLPARGATVSGGGTRQWQTRFQSTLPARGATYESTWRLEDELFQSTLPARGATCPLV